jgi:hypothetical protein
MGTSADTGFGSENPGIIPRVFEKIFEQIEDLKKSSDVMLRIYMVEIEGDRMFDMFSKKGRIRCEAYGDPKKGFFISGATEKRIETLAMEEVVKTFKKLKKIPSSRSRSKSSTILTIELGIVPWDSGVRKSTLSRVNLVDLSAEINIESILECENTELPIIQNGDFTSRMFYVSVNFEFQIFQKK